MQTPPRKSSLGSRTMGAALVTLGCSLGVVLPAQAAKELATASAEAAPKIDKPMSAQQIKLLAGHYKLTAQQIKLAEADNAQLAADEKALADFQSKLTAEQIKLEANQGKIRAMQQKIEADRKRLSAHFIKIEEPQPQKSATQK